MALPLPRRLAPIPARGTGAPRHGDRQSGVSRVDGAVEGGARGGGDEIVGDEWAGDDR